MPSSLRPLAIPNVAFYIALYEAGYKQHESEKICVEHLRHLDSHHFKTKDLPMSQKVSDYLLKKRAELAKKEGKSWTISHRKEEKETHVRRRHLKHFFTLSTFPAP